MTNKTIGLVVLVGIALASLAAAAYLAGPGADEQQTDRLVVAASIFPLADIAQHVAGEYAQVRLILPPGVSEHSDALTPQRLRELQQARVIFQIGHGLDDRLVGRVVPAIPGVQMVTVDRGIELREFEEEGEHEEEENSEEEDEHMHDTGTDPHYWLTVPNGALIAATMAETLAELDPAHAADFEKNLQDYQAELNSVETELQATARAVPRKEFIAMHDAWSYLADHYGLTLAATYEPVEGREPSLRDLETLRQTIQQYGITTFFAEPQKASSSAVSFLAREFGLKILVLDPVGGAAETGSYVDLMRFNIHSIEAGAR